MRVQHLTHRAAVLVAALLPIILPHLASAQLHSLAGTVLGAGKQPLQNASVSLVEQGRIEGIGRSFTDSTGRFSLPIDQPGAYYVWVAGVHHKSLQFPVYMDSAASAEVLVQMESVGYSEPTTPVMITGAFNRYDWYNGLLPLEKRADGTFIGTFAAPADTFSYQVIAKDPEELKVAGTQADYYVYPPKQTIVSGRAGRFASVVRSPDDSVTITFDPSLLPSTKGISESVTVLNGPPRTAAILKYQRDTEELVKPFMDSLFSYLEHQNDGGKDFALSDSTERKEILRWAEDEEDEVVRHFILMKYFERLKPGANSALARSLLRELDPASLLWSLVWSGPENLFYRIRLAARDDSLTTNYVSRIIDEHPDRRVAAAFLHARVSELFHAMQQERATDPTVRNDETPTRLEAAERFSTYYDKLITEYDDTFYADWARKEFAPERAVVPGNRVPDFSLVSLDDSIQTFTPGSLKNRFYLIEFWAVWCGPCIGEMEYLHEAYEKFKDRNFTILSISFDYREEDIAKFRAERWPMPWHHAYVKDGFFGDLAERFEVVGVPKAVLVGPGGMILATGEELRKEALLQTVEAALSDNE